MACPCAQAVLLYNMRLAAATVNYYGSVYYRDYIITYCIHEEPSEMATTLS